MPINILIVDDHPVFRKGLCLLLEEEPDMRVVGEAGDGKEAIEQVRKLSPNVVVMDITMPDLNGIEATHQILSNSPDTKVVALSMHAGKRFVKAMLSAGARGYILKDSAPKELTEGIRNVMQNEVYLSNTITGVVVSGFIEDGSEAHATETTDERTADISDATLFNKLKRPPINEKHLHRQRLLDQLDQNLQLPLTLVVAPAGYGKTSLVSGWLDSSSSSSAWISLDDDINNLRMFLRYFLAAVQDIFPGACQDTLDMVNALKLPPVKVLGNSLIKELDRVEQSFILVLDDFQCIKDESVGDLFAQLLDHPPKSIHLVLISRRDPALPLARLRAKGFLSEIRTQNLRFDAMETAILLSNLLGNQVDSSTAALLEEKTEGWVTGLRLAALSLQHKGNYEPKLLAEQVDAKYVMEYLFIEALSVQQSEILDYLMGSAILDRFTGPLCEAVCTPGADTSACEMGGWDYIAWLRKENLFLVPLDAQNRWFRYHHLFKELLLNRLKREYSAEEIKVLHTRASEWFAENGLIEEALEHTLAGGDVEAAARLVVQHGFDLMNNEQWPRLERWLKLLPEKFIYQDPELVILHAWTHVPSYRLSEMASCLGKAEALFSDSTIGAHLQGHMDGLHSFRHFMNADGKSTLTCAQRAYENIPQKHRWPRITVSILQILSYHILGDSKKAHSEIEQMIRNGTLRGTSDGFLLASPCFAYWMAGDLATMLQFASRSQRMDAHLESPAAFGHGRYFTGIANYHRNEFHIAEKKLLPLVKSHYLHNLMNFANSAFALALIYQAWGRVDEARQIAEAVVSHTLDTNNTEVMQIARAFQAEVALRQGGLAEASRWAEQFTAKPFRPMYWFYVPQLTLVRVLLAQDTRSGRENARDLLTELYDFVVSTHNTRFQIDVLALQAMLYDAQDDEPAALEALTEALEQAEPGGFIRLFVDLGPQMANLLKRLVKQNVAVRYIGRILAAFKEDELGAVPDASDPGGLSPHHPPQRSSSSQPLVEPLTNRELDLMELLAQRMSNKEIASELCISTETVKKHLNNIYGKLNVSGRRQAVEKADSLGILKQG
ncbi:response regulator [Thermodesulfobacteriota bacterium]